MDRRAKELVDFGDRLFSKREPWLNLLQEIAEQFYPERADFTSPHDWGDDYASHLTDSYPVLARRELANTLSSMLRPKDRDWFKLTTLRDEIDEKGENARWLEQYTQIVKRAIYDPRAKFVRATKEGDHDYVTFGQCVIWCGESPTRDHLLHRSCHIRDCAWLENDVGEVDHLHRTMKMQARNMKRRWGENKLHQSVQKACAKEPDKEITVRHIILPSDEYDYGKRGGKVQPFISIYVDKDNQHILSEGPHPMFNYVVPRWATISGTQYAFSPATMISLPDARLAQEMARVLLESGEKAIDPALIATREAVKGQIDIRSGGVTWVDAAYDEKMGEALRPLKFDWDFRTGLALRVDVREMLTKGMFLDKLALPESGKDMTAFEVGRRLEEFVRNALPLFEPMEVEYNNRLLETDFAILRDTDAFDWNELPSDLQGREIYFSFENPLQQAEGRAKVAQYQEMLALLAQTLQIDEKTIPPVDLDEALRDAIRGTSSPADWMLDDDAMEEMRQNVQQQAMTEQAATEIGVGSQVAGQAADSLTKLREAGLA